MTTKARGDGGERLTEPTWEPELIRTPETRHAFQALLLDLARCMAEQGLSPRTFVEAIAFLDTPQVIQVQPLRRRSAA